MATVNALLDQPENLSKLETAKGACKNAVRARARARARVRALRQWRAHLQRKVAARNTLRLRSASSIGSQLTQHERSEICATHGWHRFARMWRDRRMLIVSFSKLVRATVIALSRPDQ